MTNFSNFSIRWYDELQCYASSITFFLFRVTQFSYKKWSPLRCWYKFSWNVCTLTADGMHCMGYKILCSLILCCSHIPGWNTGMWLMWILLLTAEFIGKKVKLKPKHKALSHSACVGYATPAQMSLFYLPSMWICWYPFLFSPGWGGTMWVESQAQELNTISWSSWLEPTTLWSWVQCSSQRAPYISYY